MPLDTEQLAGESQATPETILLVEDDPNIGSFLLEAITQETPYRAIGFPASQADARELGRCTVPRVFILSTNDEFCPKPAMESYFATLPEPKRLVWVDAKDHFFAGGLDQFEEAVVREGMV